MRSVSGMHMSTRLVDLVGRAHGPLPRGCSRALVAEAGASAAADSERARRGRCFRQRAKAAASAAIAAAAAASRGSKRAV